MRFTLLAFLAVVGIVGVLGAISTDAYSSGIVVSVAQVGSSTADFYWQLADPHALQRICGQDSDFLRCVLEYCTRGGAGADPTCPNQWFQRETYEVRLRKATVTTPVIG